ncbi:efflux RND transporter periplasmic adaptor subunit [Nodularia spumigena]|uniref:efflux RND transporter periplasmic adaptor subunit n=1 Tax=Nodularia spumigena TaxID=70799 RepID=UPI002B20835E|nr:efflux RND transporter periplasmic adaptor subunit [Nodularia spumigena]MEA5612391.1 efflux RND transporter periplasmic adaptor subunit [Nodularia spumigena UHCC 0040]
MVAGVAALTGALLLASAGSALRPTPLVTVRPVLFEPSTQPPAVADRTTVTRTVQAPGWLEADPYTVAAAALTDGVIDEILVLEGESVERGQPVARLVRADAELALARAEADVRGAEAEAALARAALAAAETDWDEPIERTRAAAAARSAVDRSEAELAQLPALIAAERALAEQLAEELDRTEQARRSGAANEIEAVVARKKLQAARATVEALEGRRPILVAQLDLARAELTAAERLAELRTTERLALESARAGVLRADAALAQAVAARDEAALRLERTEIRAPISGFVQARLKYPGSKVMASMDNPDSTHIVHLYDPAKLQARVDVPLADAAEIRIGQACEVVVEILPDRTFRGEVTRITHQADLQKNTLQIKVRLIDPAPILKPEMLTRVKFLGTEEPSGGSNAAADSGVLVPEPALIETPTGHSVQAVRERRAGKGRLTTIPVTVIARADGWASVRGDLRPGDLLAVDPDRPASGRVRIALSEEPS